MLADYQMLVREQVICGTQVHVGVPDRDRAVAVARRICADLPVLLALSASSPYWLGEDTGYASYRTFVWSRWPTSGPFPEVADAAEYDALVRELIATSVITDVGMIYFDVRPSAHVPTIELRLCDATPRVDDVLLLAGLFRALVLRAGQEEDAGVAHHPVAPSLIRAAMWRAARAGLEGDLVDLRERRPLSGAASGAAAGRRAAPAARRRPATGRRSATSPTRHCAAGSSASRQRAAFRVREELTDVVDLLLLETGGADLEPRPVPTAHLTLAARVRAAQGR